jgi:hypothetical protein
MLFVFCANDMLAQNGIIKGRVYNAINNEPIPFANVVIQGTSQGATSDFDGNYILEGLETGLYNLQVSYVGFKTKVVFELQVSNARTLNFDIGLEENSEVLEAVEVKADPFSKTEESPVSLRSIGVNEIKRNPGGNRDISRAVQTLPGVATSPSFRNDILIRGGAPSENRFYIDGIEVPTINHFSTQGASGGPVGMINVDFVKDVDFYSGAFPSNRGNTLSSVFDFKFKEGNSDKLGGSFVIGSSDAGITLEGPLGKSATFIASARQSYLQFLFRGIGLPFLPTYNDFQYKVKWNIDDKNQITILAIGAIDDFALNLDANETDFQKYLLDNLPVYQQWNYTQGFKYTHFGKTSYTNYIFSRSMLNNKFYKYFGNDESSDENLILDYNSVEAENKFRIENINRLPSGFKITSGVSYEIAKYTNSTYSQIQLGDSILEINYDSKFVLQKYAAFGQVSRTFMNEKLITSFGLRIDGNNYSKVMSNPFKQISPRFSVAMALTPRINANFNTGLYYQLPAYTVLGYKENDEFVNKENDISYIRCGHIVGGLEFNTPSNSKITIEGFYKKYDNYPFSVNDSISLANLGIDFGVIGNEAFVPTSEGRAYGMEFLFQQKLFKGFYGITSYTLSWSEFKDKNGDFVPSSWDTRHIANVTLGKRFKKNWEIGLNWRFSTGLPYTPYDVETSAIIPVWDVTRQGVLDYNRLNGERLDEFHQLNFRVDKKWFFKRWNFNLFLDVQNAYNNKIDLQPYITPARDENGDFIVNENDPLRYEMTQLDNESGLLQPSIGIILEW